LVTRGSRAETLYWSNPGLRTRSWVLEECIGDLSLVETGSDDSQD
jgi:hypothetical protein